MSVSIIDTIKTIDGCLKKNPIFNYMVLKKYVFFDKDGAPYFAVLKKLPYKEYDDYDLDPTDKGFQIFVYPFSNVKKAIKKNFIASAIICINEEGTEMISKDQVYLSRIWLEDQNYKQKGIGSNLLKIIDLFALNNNKKVVCGYFAPFGFMSGNTRQVKQFYNKSNYKILTSRKSARYSFSYDLIKKLLGAKTTKLAAINFPTKKFDFTVIVPKNKIFASSYKGEEQDKN